MIHGKFAIFIFMFTQVVLAQDFILGTLTTEKSEAIYEREGEEGFNYIEKQNARSLSVRLQMFADNVVNSTNERSTSTNLVPGRNCEGHSKISISFVEDMPMLSVDRVCEKKNAESTWAEKIPLKFFQGNKEDFFDGKEVIFVSLDDSDASLAAANKTNSKNLFLVLANFLRSHLYSVGVTFADPITTKFNYIDPPMIYGSKTALRYVIPEASLDVRINLDHRQHH